MDTQYPEYVRTEWKLLALARVTQPDMSISEIADHLGYSNMTVRAWLHKADYQRYENWLIAQQRGAVDPIIPLPTPRERKALVDRVNDFAEEMFDRLQEIVDTTDDRKLLVQVAQDSLDRAGIVGQRKQATVRPTFVLTPEALEVLMRRSTEVADSNNVVVGEVISRSSAVAVRSAQAD
jgi:transposase-like protein